MVQEMLAEIKIKVEAARNLTYDAALRADAGENYRLSAEIARASSTECATFAGLKSVQVHGGYGYIKDYPVERYLRDAKTLQNMRDSISLKEGIARMLLS
jgi:butyryl-CoA dehydrogenase